MFKRSNKKKIVSLNLDEIVLHELLHTERSLVCNNILSNLLKSKKEESKSAILKSLKTQDLKKFNFSIFKCRDGIYTFTSKGSSPMEFLELLLVTDRHTTLKTIEEILNLDIEKVGGSNGED